jgi:hypothetical protein
MKVAYWIVLLALIAVSFGPLEEWQRAICTTGLLLSTAALLYPSRQERP